MRLREIRACRIRLGLSADYVGAAIGVSGDAYRRRERGDTVFKPEEIPIIAETLQMTGAEVNAYFFDGKLPLGHRALPCEPPSTAIINEQEVIENGACSTESGRECMVSGTYGGRKV